MPTLASAATLSEFPFPCRGPLPAITILVALALTAPLGAQNCTLNGTLTKPNVLTAQYDIMRDAHNSNEGLLNMGNQTAITGTNGSNGCFTQIGYLEVDQGDLPVYQSQSVSATNPIYAQPLFVKNVAVTGGAGPDYCATKCDIVVAATLNGTIFAWRADNLRPLWNRHGNPVQSDIYTAPNGDVVTVGGALWNDCASPNTQPQGVPVHNPNGSQSPLPFIGTVSTPVVDATSFTTPAMFVTSYCENNQAQKAPTWFIHEIDLTTGLDIGTPYQVNSSTVSQSAPTSGNLSAPCSGTEDCVNGTMYLWGANQNQRPALLEVTDGGNHYLEVAFGALVDNIETGGTNYLFHGWLAQFQITSGGIPSGPPMFVQNTSSAGPNAANSGSPPCSSAVGSIWAGSGTFPDEANRCGDAGTYWSSTRGPASIPNASPADIFLTSANGPFQTSTGGATGQNVGQSLLHFQTNQSGSGVAPYDSFTPRGQQQWASGSPASANTQYCGPVNSALSPPSYTASTYVPCTPALQPPQVDSACEYTPGVWTYCQSSVEVASNADWDMGTPGVLLFEDNSSNWWAVTSDKAGYGYVLNTSSLGGFQTNDPGNQFPFAAAAGLGPNLASSQPPGGTTFPQDPDRITSMAYYAYCSGGPPCSAPTGQLYFWPRESVNPHDPNEHLTALQFGSWTTQQTLTGTFTHCQNGGAGLDACGSGSDGQWTLNGSGSAFVSQVIPGDAIAACGCVVQYAPTGLQALALNSCPIVTAVTDATHLTMSKGFTEYHSGGTEDCNLSGATVQYAGLFTNPSHDTVPLPAHTGYPGGVVEVVSSGQNTNDGLLVAVVTAADTSTGAQSIGYLRTEGNIYIYNAVPNSGLTPLWTTNPVGTNVTQCGAACQAFCASSFALPTVVGGQIFLPTYAILPLAIQPTTGNPTVPCPTDPMTGYTGSYSSGLLVYGFPNQ